MLLGRLRIRGKLAVLAAIPLLAVAALTVPLVVDQVQLAGRAGDTVRSVRVAGQIGALVQDLQQERLLSAGVLVRAGDAAGLVEQTAQVTDRITDIRADLGDDLSAELAAAVDGVRQDLTPVRAAVLAGKIAPEQAAGAFGAVIGRLITAMHLGERLDLEETGSREVVALDAVLRLDEAINAGAANLVVAVATRTPAAIGLLGASLASAQAIGYRLQIYATPDQIALYNLVRQAYEVRVGRNFLTGFAADPARAVAGLSVATLFPSLQSFITLGRFVERKIATDVTSQVTGVQRRALAVGYATAGLSILVLLLVVGLSLAVASAVARPLTRLTRSADRIARVAAQELERVADDESEVASPVHLAPVDVRAQDEIGDLARAFERVQETAARLVERQVASRRNVAQMFGHVGRRTQNLVGRQVALIDQLERDEQNPDRLQYLYRLDHVSSRLRRNAGSLVVLSGETGAETHLAPLPLGDVVRLALGEIENYGRVDINVPDDLVLAPAMIGDLVLVLAELMENATTFSPPHTRVSVSATATPTGARLAIVDHGLGMPAERLAEENARLARRERLDLAPTEVLGLFVVGRLARRHGLGVTLSATPGGGVTATVEIGAQMLVPILGQLPDLPRRQQQVPPIDAYPVSPAGGTETWAVTPVEVPTPYDAAALDRVNRTLESGPSWNAFATDPEPVPAPPASPLRKRVPGAQLPAGIPPQPDRPAPQPADAESARALVEQFEAGVRRALNPNGGGLTRRVPGASLETPPPRPGRATDGPPPADPDQARALVEQFESGVARALREVRPDQRHEERQQT